MLNGKDHILQLSRRGRKRSAPPRLRENGYKDDSGRYQLSDGLQPWHERLVDYMLAYPHSKIKDLANAFGVTPQWVGQLIKSDAFREYYSMRVAKHQEVLNSTVVNKLYGVAIESLDKMHEMVTAEGDKAPSFGAVKDTAELALKGLGYTSHGNGGGGVNVNIQNTGGDNKNQVTVSSVTVDRARKKWEEHSAQLESEQPKEISDQNYEHVTSALDVELGGVEDAVIVTDDADDAE